jgi:hypothetical protein
MTDAPQLARVILSRTNYPILPSRYLDPHLFTAPVNSFEGKKSLLMSIAPSLQVAEKKRKEEEDEREAFTRCRVAKSARKTCYYDYVDVDTKMSVRPEEYERR